MKKILEKKWMPAILLCFTFFICGCELGGFNLAVYYVAEDFSLSAAAKSSFTALQYASMLFAPIVFGRLANKFPKKSILTIFGAVFTLGALIISISPNVYFYILGIIFIGTGFAIITSLSFSFIMDIYPLSNTRVTAITQTIFSVGAVISPIICSSLINSSGSNWRVIFVFITTISFLNVIFIFIGNFSIREKKVQSNIKCTNKLFPLFLVVIVSFVAFFYVGAETGFSNYIATFMREGLVSEEYLANVSISMFWALMIPSRFLVAVFPKKKQVALFVCLTGIILSILLVITAPSAIYGLVYIAMAGFFCGPVYPIVASFVTEVSEDNTVKGTVILAVLGNLGGATATFFMGPISILFGKLKYSFVMLVVLIILGFVSYSLFLIKRKSKNYESKLKKV